MKTTLFLILIFMASCKEPTVQNVAYSGTQSQLIVDNILNRRAIRKYTEEQVSKAKLDTILKCGVYAPSGLNKQPWEVRAVRNPSLLKEINNRFLKFAQGKEFQGSASRYREKGFSVFHNAPTLIIVARDKKSVYSQLDCGMMVQNMMLSAHALGLGTCPIGTLVPVLNLPENKDILDLLKIPNDFEVTINIALGYPNEKPVAPKRFDDRVKIIE